ncbi:uncharacterized protein LOC143223876 [Tachypleus tridentatus]|uniref:uncharacterized protein LOC143223876 n=1 Tax=Tachypleus tridentatus TaxID=6853 RepID=UPI003FD46025
MELLHGGCWLHSWLYIIKCGLQGPGMGADTGDGLVQRKGADLSVRFQSNVRKLTKEGLSMIRPEHSWASNSLRDDELTAEYSAVETTVVVDCPISVGSQSLPLTVGLCLHRLIHPEPVRQVLQATLNHGTIVLLQNPNSRRWVKLVRVARDCHEQNAQLTRTSEEHLVLETTRNISAGEELFVWFATDMLFEQAVPFLSPCQILGQEQYSCVVCGTTFSHPNPLKAHIMLKCSGRFKPTPCSSGETSAIPRGHCCVYCGKVYSRKYGLKIHVRTHTGYKPLKCKYCFRPFSDPSNLNKHVRLHADATSPYQCSHCGKILVRRRDLERHLRSRHSLTLESQNE